MSHERGSSRASVASAALLAGLISVASSCSPLVEEGSTTHTSALSNAREKGVQVSFAGVKVASEKGVARFSGLPTAGKPGQPALPVKIVRVLLDPDVDLAQMDVALEGADEATVPGVFAVAPVPPIKACIPPPGSAAATSSIAAAAGKDAAVYGRNALFPPSHLGKPVVGQLHRFKVVEVPVFPIRFNPVTGSMTALTNARVVVRAAAGPAPAAPDPSALAESDATDKRTAREVQRLVDNFDEAIAGYGGTAGPAALAAPALEAAAAALPTYAILSTEALRTSSTQLGTFADSKVAKGYTVNLVTGATLYRRAGGTWTCVLSGCSGGWGGGVGNVAADRLRAWLQANRVTRNIGYALLVGNPEPAAGDVPMKMAWPRFAAEGDRDAPTDFYYADLTGTWDLDRDGNFGEFDQDFAAGGADKFAELAVGRIPYYGSLEALDHILAKSVMYENAQNIAWRRNAILAMEPLDDITPSYQLGEMIRRDTLLPRGWGSHRIYDQDFGVGPESTPTTPDVVTSVWRSGTFGLGNWMSHGWSGGASDVMDVSHAQLLDDTHPSFVFQSSCSNAMPEDTSNIAYTMLRNGAIATSGGTRVTWYFGGATDYDSPAATTGNFGYRYSFYLVHEAQPVGAALNSARSFVNVDADVWWQSVIDFSLYGDPSLAVASSGSQVPTPPAAPTGLKAGPGSNQVPLTWNAIPTAARYVVRRATQPGGPYTVLSDWVIDASYTDFDVSAANDVYYYTVSAVNIAGQGPTSAPLAVPIVSLKVQYKPMDNVANDNLVKPMLQVVNNGYVSVPLSEITLRYWYTFEAPAQQVYVCDYATVSCTNIAGRFVSMPAPLTGADTYLEISFRPSAPTLQVGASTGEIITRFNKVNWTAYNEANDYSWDGTRTAYADWTRIGAYHNGRLIWGAEPTVFPVKVTGVSATAGNAQVTLAWNAALGAQSYVIRRATATGGPYTTAGTTTTTSFVNRFLTNGTTYYFTVAGRNAAGEGAASDPVAATPRP
jgi:hypothetical protein